MKSVCLINGSLRGKKASSLEFLKDVTRRLPDTEYGKTVITVRAKVKDSYSEDILESMAGADAIIFIFPLYAYGLPGALMRLLEDYYQYIQAGNGYNKDAKVYVIVNCGFPRPAINGEAVRVIKNFCRKLFLSWRFAICIGSGPVVVATRKIPFLDMKLKKAYAEIASDIQGGNREEKDNYLIRPLLPEPVILMIKNQFEKKGHMIEPNNKPLRTDVHQVTPISGRVNSDTNQRRGKCIRKP